MADAPALLSVSDLRLSYGNQVLLDGVSISIAPGEKVGLVGRNGCGKTSLLRILAGESEPDAGTISRRRGLQSGYLPQEFELDPAKNVFESISDGAADVMRWRRRYEEGECSVAEMADLQEKIDHADGWNLETRIRAESHALGVPPAEVLVGTLSGGEKRRVALCRALAPQPELLLLDEPTNHLDAVSIQWLEGFLLGFPGALLFVTHDRYFLESIATRIIELAEGRVFSHPGNYAAFLEAKALRQQIASQGERRRQRFLRAELEYVRAGVRAQRSKSRHRLDTFYAVAGIEAPPEEREMDLLLPEPPELGNVAVELAGAGACIDGRWLFRGLDLAIRPGQCTGIVGRNGAGKTTLLRLCLGERPADEGTVTIGKRVVFNTIDQTRMGLDGRGTVLQEVASAETVRFGNQTLPARAYLRRFLFDEHRINERVDKLSGGERARLMLAKVLCRGGNVIVLDEPTNDLDLPSLRMLEEALIDFTGSVIAVSHDRYFLDRICDQVVAFEDDKVHVHSGNYSYYLEKKTKAARAAKQSPPAQGVEKPSGAAVPTPPGSRPRKFTYKERQEWETIEARILAEEEKAAALAAQLEDPEFFLHHSAEAPALSAQLDRNRATIESLYQRWEFLSSLAPRDEPG